MLQLDLQIDQKEASSLSPKHVLHWPDMSANDPAIFRLSFKGAEQD